MRARIRGHSRTPTLLSVLLLCLLCAIRVASAQSTSDAPERGGSGSSSVRRQPPAPGYVSPGGNISNAADQLGNGLANLIQGGNGNNDNSGSDNSGDSGGGSSDSGGGGGGDNGDQQRADEQAHREAARQAQLDAENNQSNALGGAAGSANDAIDSTDGMVLPDAAAVQYVPVSTVAAPASAPAAPAAQDDPSASWDNGEWTPPTNADVAIQAGKDIRKAVMWGKSHLRALFGLSSGSPSVADSGSQAAATPVPDTDTIRANSKASDAETAAFPPSAPFQNLFGNGYIDSTLGPAADNTQQSIDGNP